MSPSARTHGLGGWPFLTIADAAQLIERRQLSPVDLVQSVLDRIEQTEGRLHAFAVVVHDGAMRAARDAEVAIQRGDYRGPLHGIPIALKDLYYTAGIPTEAGSKVLKGFVPTEDATVTRRLLMAGAIVVGKTVTHEFANALMVPPTRNPWDLERTPGASSAGSAAAVAAHACLAAMGTDTGGSIRMPAALSGLVGLKPTFGRVSKRGVIPLSWSLDHCGPMTKTVEDAALMMNVIAGYDPLDSASVNEPVPDYTAGLRVGVRGLRMGVPTNYFFGGTHEAVRDAVSRAIGVLEQLGAVPIEVEIPHVELSSRIGVGILVPEASSLHQTWLRERSGDYQEGTRARLELGELLLATQYLRAQRARTLIKHAFRDVFTENRLDFIVTPTVPSTATRIGQMTIAFEDTGEETCRAAFVRQTFPFNLAGLPALSVPCGFSPRATKDGSGANLPIGLQITGRPFDEGTVLRVGSAYEEATSWHDSRPPI